MAGPNDFDDDPPRRRRDKDDFDDDPPRRRRDRDDDFDDRARRNRERDDYDDAPRQRSRGVEYGPLDKMFLDTAFPLLILFGVCCNGIALILSIICLATAKHPEAKSRATTLVIISGIITVLGIGFRIIGAFAR